MKQLLLGTGLSIPPLICRINMRREASGIAFGGRNTIL
jgi:hypothetical protein